MAPAALAMCQGRLNLREVFLGVLNSMNGQPRVIEAMVGTEQVSFKVDMVWYRDVTTKTNA